jgi:subtilisin family serine protease
MAGVAALSLAVNPSLTNAELVTILEKSADVIGPPGYGASFGWGRVNAFNAVSAARQALFDAEPWRREGKVKEGSLTIPSRR